MKVAHISFARIKERDPERWLQRIDFFCGILEKMTAFAEVLSIHSIDHNGEIERNNVKYFFIKRHPSDDFLLPSINTIVSKLQPDVMIVHGLGFPWQVFILRRFLKPSAKLFVQNHAERPFRSYKSWLQRIADPRIDGYFFASRDLANAWVQKKQIATLDKVHEVMEVSSVFQPLPRDETQKKLSLHETNGYLWVGRLNENKNPILLVSAFLKFLDTNPDAKLYIIFQEKDLLNEIMQILDQHPDKRSQIILVGAVSHTDMVFWYSSMRYIISTSKYEGSGVAVCEAMSCGCIPVLTDIASFRMMTDNGRIGLLYRSNDQQALLDALHKTTHMDHATICSDVIAWFNQRLSFDRIAKDMLAAIDNKSR